MLCRTTAVVLVTLCVLAAGSAGAWHHPLYLPGDGYWAARLRVEITNAHDRDAAGAPVDLAVGRGPGKADLVGAEAGAVRVVNAEGAELLFALYDPAGAPVRRGPIPEGATLVLPAECPAGGAVSYYVYFDNPGAWAVPDFLETSLTVRNGGLEHGEGDAPTGWRHDPPDAQREASWTTENPRSGSRCLKTTVAEGAQWSWISTRQSGIHIIGGARYVMRGWVRAEGVEGDAGWYLHVGNDANPMAINHILSGGGGIYDWKEVSFEFTAPADADQASLGTVLWGTGVAWFDDVSLECLDPPLLTASAAPPERLTLTGVGADAPWYDDDPGDDVQWEFRWPATLVNVADAPSGLTQVDLARVLGRPGMELNEDSLRVTEDGTPLPAYRVGGSLLVAGEAAPQSVTTWYLYLSRDERIPAAPGADYAGLLESPVNLIQNPSFELGDPLPEGWRASDPTGAMLTLDAPGKFGERCARIDFPDEGEKSWLGWTQDVAVEPGASYLYAAWVKCQNLHDGDVRIYAHYRNAAGELCETQQYADAGPSISGATDWTLLSGVFHMPPDCVNFQIHLTMNARGTVWHDGAVVVPVSRANVGRLECREEPPGVSIWPVNALVKVFADDPQPAAPAPARISAARNEKEPLQIAFRSAETLPGVRVEVDPPAGPGGFRLEEVEIAVVGYVPVDHPTNYYWSALPAWRRKIPASAPACDGWAGLWPDPLLPTDRFDLAPGVTQPVWITLSVPRGAPAGEYEGRVRLLRGDAVLTELPFTVRVWDFELPDEPALAAVYDVRFGDFWGEPGKSRAEVHAEIVERMAANRLCPDAVWPEPIVNYQDGVVSTDFSAHDAAAARYFDELHLPHAYTPWQFYLFGWGHPPYEKWGEAPYEGAYPYDDADPGQLRPEFKQAYQACLRAYWEHMKERGWADRVILYISDEPCYWNPRIIEQMKALCQMIHEVDPDIPIYASTWHHVPEWDGYLTVWGIGHYGIVSPEKMEELRARGDRIYFTTDGQMCTDTPFLAIERLLPHYCFHYGAEAYEFWGVPWYTYNPYEYGWHAYIRQSDQPGVTGWVRYPNGDGFLLYPGGVIGHDGPVSSLRFEQAREGVEDHLYLSALSELVALAAQEGRPYAEGEAALALARELVPVPNPGGRYSTQILPDPAALFLAREAVALALERGRPFDDVAAGHWAYREILACRDAGIVSGFPDGTYRPSLPVSRDQMAVFISRAMAGGDASIPTGPATATFEDVPSDHWAYKYVEYAVAHAIVQGYDAVTYAPTLAVDRAQMAVFVARGMEGGDEGVADPPAEPRFPDVPADHWAYRWIEHCAAEGVVAGYPDSTYRPDVAVSRDQMAVFVQRAFRLPM